MRHQLVEFFEGSRVEQQVHPLARGELPRGVLARQPFGAPAEFGQALQFLERAGVIDASWFSVLRL
jgi:hypothetical protein